MRPSQKVALIDAVARELQRRNNYDEIDLYLNENGIRTPDGTYDSKASYSGLALSRVMPATLLRIVEDLEIGDILAKTAAQPPRIWPDDSKLASKNRMAIRTTALSQASVLEGVGMAAVVGTESSKLFPWWEIKSRPRVVGRPSSLPS
jgi:hypothetical protein